MPSTLRNSIALLVLGLGVGSSALPAGATNVSLYRSSMSYREEFARNNEWPALPTRIAEGDFNGDGNPDFAVANLDSGFAGQPFSISVLTHAGTQYLPPLPWSASNQPDFPALNEFFSNYSLPPVPVFDDPTEMTSGDFNGDGRTDIAVARWGASGILWNTGASPASGKQFVAKSSAYAINRIGTADFDNDGVPEIVGLTFSSTLNVLVFHAAADTLQLIGTTPLGPLIGGGYPPFMSIADVTGDGLPDVVAIDGDQRYGCTPAVMRVATGYSGGTFASILGPFAPGAGVSDMAVAPMNGDAIPDVVVVTPCTNTVWISLGHPGGSFDPGVAIALPHTAEHVCAGDLDGDGAVDLITLASNSPYLAGTVCVLKGNGDGTFGPPIAYDGLPQSRTSGLMYDIYFGDAVLSDVNRDGRPDLVATEMGNGHTIGVLLNDGAGGFRSGTRSAVAQRTYRQAIADFNRDGMPDVASSGMSEVTIGFGNGTGKFTPGPSFSVTHPTTLVAGDINRDGKMDVLVQSGDQFWDHSFRPYLGNGDGTFTPQQLSFAGLVYPRSIADVSRDGIPDIVAFDGQNVKVYAQNQFGFWSVLYQIQGPASTPWGIATADWNRDGYLDIALASDLGIHPYTSTGPGTWTQNPVSIGIGRFTDVCSGDFNRDGYVDLAGRLDTSGSSAITGVQVFLNGPSGLQQATIKEVSTLEKRGFFLDSWDADIDGIPDLIASGASGLGNTTTFTSFDVLAGNGHGEFGFRTSYAMGTVDETALLLTTSGEYLASGDVNRDGIPDLLAGAVVSPDSSHVYAALTSPPTFTASLHDAVFKTTVSNPKDVAVGDLDRDGKLDVVTGTSGASSGVAVHRGGGGGSIGSATTLVQSWYGSRVRLADLNRDGTLDIVGASSVAGALRIYTMLGAGDLTFGSRVDYVMNVGGDIEIGDMNRDGIPDVVVATPDSVRVLRGTGTGTFTAFSGVPLPGPIYDIDLADLNRDGVLDVVCAKGTVSAIYGNANGTLAAPVTLVGIQSQNCRVVCVADLNRDGFLDIVANEATGYYVAFGEAALPFASVFISILPQTAFDMKVAPMAANGLPYLVVSGWLDRIEVASVGAFGTLTSIGNYPVSGTPESAVLADMDRDGLLDVVSVGSGASSVAINLRGTGTVTSVQTPEAPAPRVVQLHQNYPNPFNPQTTIRFSLPEKRNVRLTVHDAQGRLVTVLHDHELPAGHHSVPWFGKNSEGHPVASGVYFYRLATDDGTVHSKRMVLVK